MPTNDRPKWPSLRLGRRRDPARAGKIFCIGMQRTGTTSIGDFCEEQLGLPRRGYPVSRSRGWTRAWFEGRLDRVFRDRLFQTGMAFDDDPWWCPGVYERLAREFTQAKFVMFLRDPDDWFSSLMAHSGGRSPGETDIHARIYDREDEYMQLVRNTRSRIARLNGFLLEPERERYIRIYRRHVSDVMTFFEDTDSDRFFSAQLDDPDKFRKLAIFLGFEDRDYEDVHSNASPHR